MKSFRHEHLFYLHLYMSSQYTCISIRRTYLLNIRFLACTKVELQDLTVCIVVNGETFDIDLDPMKLNIELVRAIFIFYNVFQFEVHVPRSISS